MPRVNYYDRTIIGMMIGNLIFFAQFRIRSETTPYELQDVKNQSEPRKRFRLDS